MYLDLIVGVLTERLLCVVATNAQHLESIDPPRSELFFATEPVKSIMNCEMARCFLFSMNFS